MEWVLVTVCGREHRIAKPVADTLGLNNDDETDDEAILDRIIELNFQLIDARNDVIASLVKSKEAGMANDHDEYQAALAEHTACKKAYYAARNAMFKAEDRMKEALRKVSAPHHAAFTVDEHGNRLQE